LFGFGISAEFNGQLKLSEMIGISFNLGYKTNGYLLGKQLDSVLNLGAGIIICNKQNDIEYHCIHRFIHYVFWK
jgi:hypothetical protein